MTIGCEHWKIKNQLEKKKIAGKKYLEWLGLILEKNVIINPDESKIDQSFSYKLLVMKLVYVTECFWVIFI